MLLKAWQATGEMNSKIKTMGVNYSVTPPKSTGPAHLQCNSPKSMEIPNHWAILSIVAQSAYPGSLTWLPSLQDPFCSATVQCKIQQAKGSPRVAPFSCNNQMVVLCPHRTAVGHLVTMAPLSYWSFGGILGVRPVLLAS